MSCPESWQYKQLLYCDKAVKTKQYLMLSIIQVFPYTMVSYSVSYKGWGMLNIYPRVFLDLTLGQ